jgi:AcrR family transcriptional regulator
VTSSTPAPDAPTKIPTRELIATAARELFEHQGYTATSVRAIAAAAKVDPALVIRHFGSKEQLFIHVIGLEEKTGGPELEGPRETLGERLVSYVLDAGQESLRRTIGILTRASDLEHVREGLRRTMRNVFIDNLAGQLPGPDSALRAQLLTAQLGGLIQAWSTIEDAGLSDGDRDRVIALYGRALQVIIDADDVTTDG